VSGLWWLVRLVLVGEAVVRITAFPKKKDLQGLGGMHFHDLDNLRPRLAWEPLARISQLTAASSAAFSEVTYELRTFLGGRSAVAVAPFASRSGYSR
jgi:hypothetical protein